MIVMAPFWSPEVPIPAMARPAMSIFDELAAPQTSEPAANRNKKEMKVHWISVSQLLESGGSLVALTLALKYVYILPVNGCNAALARLYADPYHPTSSRERNSVVISGMALFC